MRTRQVLGLCIGIGLALLVPVGTGTAFASTVLCEAEEEPCAAENIYGPGAVVEASSSEAILKNNLFTVICTGSNLKGETAGEAGAPLPVDVSTLTFSGCKNGGTECTVSTLESPYLGQIEASGKNVGTFKLRSGDAGNPTIKAQCGSVACTYSSEVIELSLNGGNPGELVASEESLKKVSGLLCSETATGTATYSVQKPKPIDLSKFTTKLCKKAPENNETTCPVGEGFSGDVKGALFVNVTITSTGTPTGTVTCTESPLSGNFNNDGTGEISSLKFTGNMKGECTSILTGNPKVAVSMANLPAKKTAFTYFGLGKGLLTMEADKNLELNLLIAGEKDPCVYKLTAAELIAANPGAFMTLKTDPWVEAKTKGPATCPPGIEVKTTWSIESADGKNIWMAEK